MKLFQNGHVKPEQFAPTEMPMEFHLNSCGIEVLGIEQDGVTMRQLRITHVSGMPLTFVLTLPEKAANAIGRQLTGSQLVVVDEISE